jgi:uncharacterized protein (TIGR03437 family)
MDAAQKNTTRIAFCLASALLSTAHLSAATPVTLSASSTTVTIGSSSCNDFQTVLVGSSDGSNQPFTVSVQYPNNANGTWLYASVPSSGSTSTSTPFSANTGTTGVSLTIGLNLSIGAATPSATVVITPTNNPTAVVNITAFYTINTSCGGNTGSASNGFITITPGNIALTAGASAQASQTMTIQDTTANPMTFAVSVSPNNSWLSFTATSLTIAGSGTTAVSISGNGTKVATTGTYNGIVTVTPQSGFGSAINIPVVFTVTSGSGSGGGGGTLTVNGATSSTFTTSFSEVEPINPGPQCIPIQDTSAGANYYNSLVTTSTGGSWLLANFSTNGTTPAILAPGSNACVTVSLNNTVASTLASGAFQGSIALTSSSGAKATITVNLYVSSGPATGVSVNPAAIFVFNNVAVGANVVQQQNFSLVAASGYGLSPASLTSSAGGFSISTPVATNNAETFTVVSNSSGLVAGVYSTTVTVASTGPTNGTTTITIVLPVGQAGTTGTGTGGVTSVVAPTALSFQLQQGNPTYTSEKDAQTITITGQQGTAWSASIVYGSGSGWLTFDSPAGTAVSGTFGSGPTSLVVDLLGGVTGLSPSNTAYTATINIVTPSGTQTVAVSLLVTPANVPVLLARPASAEFSSNSGTVPANQTITVVGSDNTGSTSSPAITVGATTATWLTATATGNSMTLSVNPSGQATGVYSATVPVTASAYPNAVSFPVVLVVNGGGTGSTGPLTLSSTSLTYTNVVAPISQNVNVTASAPTAVSVTSQQTTCGTSTWLQVSPTSFSATTVNSAVTVTVNPSGINNGTTCTGVISLVTASAVQTVNVSMTVGTATGTGNVTVNSTTLSFAYTQQQSVPAAQTVTVVSASGSAAIPFTVATAVSGGVTNWLSTNVTSAQTPYNSPGLSVTATPGSLGAGVYQGTVTITPTGGTPVVINVTLTVTGSQTVSATPTTLSLAYQVGGTSPTGTIQVSGGGSAAPFSATAASTGNWLVVAPTSGTTPNTGTVNLAVSIDPAQLGTLLPGSSPYTGTITVAGTSPATGSTVVNVTLTVTAPLPAITSVTNGGSFATGPVSPGEIISIFANASNPIGPATSVQLDGTTCPSPCVQVPTSMGGVQVKFLPTGDLAPLTFVSAGQINAIVPYKVAGVVNLSVEVIFLGQTSNAFPVVLASTAPGIFTVGNGTGQAAAEEYSPTGVFNYNSAATPAHAGYVLVIYMTGEGLVNPAAVTGSVTQVSQTPPPLTPQPFNAPSVLIDSQPCTVQFYGEAPGLVSGVLQINVLVPQTTHTGPVALSISIGSAATPSGVTVNVQ